jgi:hypothetical protein
MSEEKDNDWEEIRRIEKVFKKQKGKDTAITIKSIEELDEPISIMFTIKNKDTSIELPLTTQEWKNLKNFFVSVDTMLIGEYKSIGLEREKIDKIQIVSESESEIKKTGDKVKQENLSDQDETGTEEILDFIEELTKPDDSIGEQNVVDSSIEVENTKKSSEEKKSILPKPIELEDLPVAEPLKDVPFPTKITKSKTKIDEQIEKSVEEINQEIEKAVVETKSEEKPKSEPDVKAKKEVKAKPEAKTEPDLGLDEKQKAQKEELRVDNLDALINEIAVIKENILEDSLNETRAEVKDERDLEKESDISEKIIPEAKSDKEKRPEIEQEIETEIETDIHIELEEGTILEDNIQSELKEILNEPETIEQISLDEMIYESEVNKNSPRIPKLPERFVKKPKPIEKIEEPPEDNETRIIKAMEETASLLPEGPAKNFVLEMRDKRKKIIKQSEDF